MSIININSPTNNLQRQMANIQVMNIAIDYKKVNVSKNTDRAYEGKLKDFLQYCDVLHPDDMNPRPSRCFIFFIIVLTGRKKTHIQKNVLSN